MVLSLLLFAFYKTNPFTLFNLYGSKVRCAKLLMWRFVSHKAGISSSSFRTILNVASVSKLTTIAADFDNGIIGKLSTGSRVQSFPRAFSFGVLILFCLLSSPFLLLAAILFHSPNIKHVIPPSILFSPLRSNSVWSIVVS